MACKRGDEEAEQEQWVMVGGSSQPRRHQQQQPTAHHQQPGAADGIATAAQCSSSLPGWGASGGGFTYSSSGSRRKHKDRQATLSPQQAAEQLARRVGDIAGELRQSAVFAALTAAMQQAAGACSEQQQEGTSSTTNSSSSSSWDWSAVQQLVVYGLGSPVDSKVSQHQLALVLLLQEQLPGLQQPPQLFDPAFCEADVLLLQQLGACVIADNEQGARSVGGQHTLFYLPHCEGVLCDNLLAANWSAEALRRLAILGNSFDTYQQRWSGPSSGRPSTRRPDKLLALVEHGAVVELRVPDHKYAVASAFNDMSLHTFPTAPAVGCGSLFNGATA